MFTFLRVDDRLVHAQLTQRWAKERACDGIIVVNDKAANNALIQQIFQTSYARPVFTLSKETWKKKGDFYNRSKKRYFLITKDIEDMAEILLEPSFVLQGEKEVVVGTNEEKQGAIELGKHQYLTSEEAKCCQDLQDGGYQVIFALLKETQIGTWDDFKSRF